MQHHPCSECENNLFPSCRRGDRNSRLIIMMRTSGIKEHNKKTRKGNFQQYIFFCLHQIALVIICSCLYSTVFMFENEWYRDKDTGTYFCREPGQQGAQLSNCMWQPCPLTECGCPQVPSISMALPKEPEALSKSLIFL